MQVDAPAIAPDAPLVPGRRAERTREALLEASKGVIKTLTDRNMVECFPEFATVFDDAYGAEDGKEQLGVLMRGLKDMVAQHFNAGIPLAWDDMCEQYDFVARANELDRIVDEAKARQKAKDAPRNLFLKGADGRITFPNATVPVLRQATAELSTRRLALAERNKATYEEIAKNSAIAERTERQVREILADFEKSVATLKSVDIEGISDVQERLVEAVPAEARA